MKKFMRFLCAAMLLVSFAACDEKDNQNDDSGDNGGGNTNYSTLILGNWQVDMMTVDGMNVTPSKTTLGFNADGSGKLGLNETEYSAFTWSINGSTINITADKINFAFTIDSITATECGFHGSFIELAGESMNGDIRFHMTKISGGDNPDDPDPGNLGVSTPIMLENTTTSLMMRAQITGDIDIYLSQFPDYTYGFLVSCDAPLSIDHNAFPCNYHDADGTFTLLLTGLEPTKDYMVAAWLRLTPDSDPIISNMTVMQTLNNYDPSIYWVDLGLPSGLLWASMNIGANSPIDFGDYFAWGEREPKSTYTWDNYRYGHGSHQLTKYCDDPAYGLNGYTDNLTTLETNDDAAFNNPFGNARMPTKTEWEELVNNTTHVWTSEDGINGWRFTAPNGNSIFLPAAGDMATSINGVNQTGHYLSSTLGSDGPDYAWQLGFTATQLGGDLQTMTRTQRRLGSSVRAVHAPED